MNEKHKTAIVQIFSVVVLLVCVASVIYSLDSLKESYREAEAHEHAARFKSYMNLLIDDKSINPMYLSGYYKSYEQLKFEALAVLQLSNEGK